MLKVEPCVAWAMLPVYERLYTQAADYYHQALAIATELDTPSEHGAVLHRQGDLCLAQGQHREALDIWVQALSA